MELHYESVGWRSVRRAEPARPLRRRAPPRERGKSSPGSPCCPAVTDHLQQAKGAWDSGSGLLPIPTTRTSRGHLTPAGPARQFSNTSAASTMSPRARPEPDLYLAVLEEFKLTGTRGDRVSRIPSNGVPGGEKAPACGAFAVPGPFFTPAQFCARRPAAAVTGARPAAGSAPTVRPVKSRTTPRTDPPVAVRRVARRRACSSAGARGMVAAANSGPLQGRRAAAGRPPAHRRAPRGNAGVSAGQCARRPARPAPPAARPAATSSSSFAVAELRKKKNCG